MSDLVKVDNLGLEENKAKKIAELFNPMLGTMEELESEFNEVVKLKPSKDNCKTAKTLRLKYVKIRTGSAEIHKKAKADILLEGRVMDGWKNTCALAVGDKEEKLKTIENHFENIEKERISQLQITRAFELTTYGVEPTDKLGVMMDEVWTHYIAGVKADYEARIEAEKKAEQERKEQEARAELENHRQMKTSRLIDYIIDYDNIIFADLSEEDFALICESAINKREAYEAEQERIRKENEKLKAEADKAEKARIAEQKEREAEAFKVEKAREAKEQKEREAYEAKINAEREEKEQLLNAEKERQAQAQAEEKARIAEQKKAEKAPDKQKLIDYIHALRNVIKPVVKSSEANGVLTHIDMITNEALKQIERI